MPKNDFISVDKLYFDPHNPRLPSYVRDGGEAAVLKWMLTEGDLIELMTAIAATGYSSSEALLVTQSPTKGQYIVVEGNRRLAAVKLLMNPESAPTRQKTILNLIQDIQPDQIEHLPVIIYEARDDILDFLGFRHITGIKSWGARAKADYLRQLFNRHHKSDTSEQETIRTISNIIGSKPYYVNKLLVAHEIVSVGEEENFWGSDQIDYEELNFSVLHTALGYENIRKFAGTPTSFMIEFLEQVNKKQLSELLEWVVGKNKIISESRELKELNYVLGNETALSKIRNGYALKIAATYTGIALDDFRSLIATAYQKLEEADRLAINVDNFDETDLDDAKNVYKLARKISKYIEESSDE